MRFLLLALITFLSTGVRAQTCQLIGAENFKPYTATELMAAKNNTDTLVPWCYMEVDHDYVSYFASPADAELEFRAAFAEVAKRYEQPTTTTKLQLDLMLHTAPSGYTATSSFDALFEFRAARAGHPADVKQLISLRGSGGIAFLDAVCGPNAFSYSSVQPYHAPYTTYGWTVNVIGHELGHLFGAQHTQACVWNGDNTPIDGCYQPEGTCPRPGLPDTGSMMSYCHLVSTVQNSTRILPQTGAAMRARMFAAGCVEIIPATEAPEPCTDFRLPLSLLTDLHPRETAWTVTTDGGTLLAASPAYAKDQYLTELTDTLCLPEGCYTLTVTDAAGDGFSDERYGYGSLQITHDGASLALVEAFTDSITLTFCVGESEPQACDYLDLAALQPYGSNQDNGTLAVNGTAATITGNGWKALAGTWEITPATIVEVEVKAGPVGEILGIGFDDNNVISSNRTFRLGGAQAWGIGNYAEYPQQGGGWYRVNIPVGQFYTGTFNRLFLVNDNDALPVTNVAQFKNLRVHDGECGAANVAALGADAGAKKGSIAGFYFDVDSPYLLTNAHGQTLLRGYARNGTTLRLDDLNAPLGVYFLSYQTGEGPRSEKLFFGPRLR